MRAPAVLHRKTLERGGAQVMSYSRAGTGRISIIYCISNTDISSAKKLHLPPLSLQKGVLTNSFQETEASCTSRCPAASLCFQVPFLREKCSWQILPFPYSDNFTELNKKQFERFKLFSAACSVAAASRAGSWQQDVTHWWCILNVDPKRMAPASGRLAAAPGVPTAHFQLHCLLQGAVISHKSLSYLCYDRPGLSWNSETETLAAGWLHFSHFQD